MEVIDNLSDLYEDEKDIFKKGKVSLKMVQLGMTYEEKLENLKVLLNYALKIFLFGFLLSTTKMLKKNVLHTSIY